MYIIACVYSFICNMSPMSDTIQGDRHAECLDIVRTLAAYLLQSPRTLVLPKQFVSLLFAILSEPEQGVFLSLYLYLVYMCLYIYIYIFIIYIYIYIYNMYITSSNIPVLAPSRTQHLTCALLPCFSTAPALELARH